MTSVREAVPIASDLTEAISTAFFGPRTIIQGLITRLFSRAHVLLEDIPGTGKTTLSRAVAQACGANFGRIECSPDLLPADIIGMMIWDPHESVFSCKPVPVTHQFILVGEINRATTRTQAALLESMKEGAVTVAAVRYELPQPSEVGRGIDTATLLAIRKAVSSVAAADSVNRYIIRLSTQTRATSFLRLGLRPRASAHMFAAAQVVAAIAGRDYVIPEDVYEVFLPSAAHRVVLSGQASV